MDGRASVNGGFPACPSPAVLHHNSNSVHFTATRPFEHFGNIGRMNRKMREGA